MFKTAPLVDAYDTRMHKASKVSFGTAAAKCRLMGCTDGFP